MTVLGVYGSAAGICFLSALIGQAVMSACGRRSWSWLAPPVGLSVLLSVAATFARLPGRATTALIAILALAAGSAFYLRGRVAGLRDAARLGLPVAALITIAVSVPFVVSDRVGAFGTLVLSDFSEQLFIADWLRTEFGEAPGKVTSGYPLGPQCLAAVFADAGVGPVSATLTGLMLAVPVLTGLAALSALGGLSRWRRLIGATLVGIPYLGVAYMLQSGFKETIFGLVLLAFVLALREARPDSETRGPVLFWPGVPLGLLAGGAMATYGLPGLAWLAAILACWLVAEAVAGRWRSPDQRFGPFRWYRGSLRIGLAVALIAIGPQVAGTTGFTSSDPVAVTSKSGLEPGDSGLANLHAVLPAYEGFGVWPSADYRHPPAGTLGEAMSALIGVAAILFGLGWWVRRRDLAVPAGVIACLAIWAVSSVVSIAFFSAKALAVMAPVAMLVALGPLLGSAGGGADSRSSRIAAVLLTTAFMGGCGYSSYLALQGAQVDSDEREDELDSFRPFVGRQSVLYLIHNVFPGYRLTVGRPVEVAGELNDWDAVRPQVLSQVDFAITVRTAYQSAPPRGFRRIRATRSFVLWQRLGRVDPQRTPADQGGPGGVLDCGNGNRSVLNRPGGVAAIFPTPPRTNSAWTPVPGSDRQEFRQRLRLPRGHWQLSLQYFSQVGLTASTPGTEVSLPAVTGKVGAFWPLATGEGDGRAIEITVRVDRPLLSRLLGRRLGPRIPELLLGDLAAVRQEARKTIPIQEACGRYVDWYRLGRPTGGSL